MPDNVFRIVYILVVLMARGVLFLDTAKASIKDLAKGRASWILKEPFGEIDGAIVALCSFSFTNWFINVSATIGNNKFYFSDDPLLPLKFTITIPDGSYSFSDLNTYIINEVQSMTGTIHFQMLANYSTNKVAIQFNTVGWYVHFDADSPYTILGFTNPQDVPASKASTLHQVEYAPNIAQFNNITNIKVCTNLTSESISNTNQSSVIYTTAPLVSVGSTQTSEPNNLLWLNSTPLHDKLSEIQVWLVDQNDSAIVMTEDFTCTLIVRS